MSCGNPVDAAGQERLIDRLNRMPVWSRKKILTDFLRQQLSLALVTEPSEVGLQDRLMDLGIDSLKAIEVKLTIESQLGVELCSSLLFDYPTLEALTGYLLNPQDHSMRPQWRTSTEALAETEESLGNMDGLSEESLAEMLAAELHDLRQDQER
jgi:acyl carrier protein